MHAYERGQPILTNQESATEALKTLIKKKNNAITLYDYMAFCLSDIKYGYYSTKKPLGRLGDFITSPEISQIFGELIGLWIVNMYEALGQPSRLHILELGPGRGMLMKDAVRSFAINPSLNKSFSLNMIELNPHLRKDQIRACSPHHVNHYYDLASALSHMTDAPLIVIANEYFDALPIHQYIYKEGHWHERTVSTSNEANQNFAFSHEPVVRNLENLPKHAPEDGDIWEYNGLAHHQIDLISAHINRYRGAGLIIDYGYAESEYGDTLQAISKHEYVSPFSNPGAVDLTTHVNFELLQSTVRHHNLTTTLGMQGQFLSSMGIHDRTEHLANATDDVKQSQAIREATTRLTHSLDMGTLFKVLSFWKTDP